jgi:hypothetical protein
MIDQSTFMDSFVQAIATKMGFYQSWKNIEPISQKLNNPGCLEHWKDSNGKSFPVLNGYVNFPNASLGFGALKAQSKINILKRGLTFREFFMGKPRVYDGFCKRGTPRDAALEMANFVCNWVVRRLGIPADSVTLDTPIYTLITGAKAPELRKAA